MKKIIIMLLIATISLSSLNGCMFLLADALLSEDETTTEETTTDISIETTTHHVHRYNKVCGETSVCMDCGKDDGKIVEHTTDLGVCENCGQEFRKQSPVTIIGRTWEKDYVGGVQWTFQVRNNTDKPMKYIILKWICYNAVGDIIYDDIDGDNYVKIRCTGPLEAHTTSPYWQNSVKFYNHSYNSSRITEISVEYMDGTIEEVGKYHDNIVE